MIFRNDLYDISAVFAQIRDNIQCKHNILILEKLLEILLDESPPQSDNSIRKALRVIDELEKERWYFVYHENVYTQHTVLKKQNVYSVIIKSIQELILLLKQYNYDVAYDLIDCIHCLPDIIADNNFTITKSYWRNHVDNYRKKRDKNFLVNEQKLFKRFIR